MAISPPLRAVLDVMGIGRQKSLGEDHVALRTVVVGSESAADSGLVVSQWPPRETEARHEKVRRVVETSRRSSGYGQRGRAGGAWNSASLLSRNTIPSAYEAGREI